MARAAVAVLPFRRRVLFLGLPLATGAALLVYLASGLSLRVGLVLTAGLGAAAAATAWARLVDPARLLWVVIGDPWNGSSWQVKCKVFEDQVKVDNLNINGFETPAPAGKKTSEWVIAKW